MTKDKKIGFSLLGFCLYLAMMEINLYLVIKSLLDFAPFGYFLCLFSYGSLA